MVNSCPTQYEIGDFTVGNLVSPAFEAVAEHLTQCPECQETAEKLEDVTDALIAELRQPVIEYEFEAEPQLHNALAEVRRMISHEPTDDLADRTQGLTDSASIAPPPVAEIAGYRLIEQIGHGGMGTVYKALHTHLDRHVALKLLPAERMWEEKAVARFHKEMRAVGKLDHPNLVKATDAGEENGTHYLVMELIDGVNLSRLSSRRGPLPIAEACELIRQAAVGLQYAHEHGLVHRDIKPSNLMLATQVGLSSSQGERPDAVVKILDLGLALLHAHVSVGPDGEPTTEALTAADQVMGTIDYMAPEQFTDTHGVDIRADIYALGCTLYKLLTGHTPFGDPSYKTMFDKMLAHKQDTVPPIHDGRADVPSALVAVLDRMLAKEPNDRYAIPAEVAEAIAPFAHGANLPRLIAEATATENARETQTDGTLATTLENGTSALSRTRGEVTEPQTAKPQPRDRRVWGWRWWAVAAAVVLLFVGPWLFSQITIRIKEKDGRETTVEVSDEAQITIEKDGKTLAKIPAESTADESEDPDEASEDKMVTILEGRATDCSAYNFPVAFSPDGMMLASGGDSKLRLWDVKTKSVRRVLEPGGSVTALAFTPDGSLLAVGHGEGSISLLDTATETMSPVGDAHGASIQTLAVSPDGSVLASGYADGAIKLWDLAAKQETRTLTGHTGKVHSVTFSPDGKLLASGCEDKTVKLWDCATGELKKNLDPGSSVAHVAFSPDGSLLAAATSEGKIPLFEVATGSVAKIIPGHEHHARCVAFSPDGSLLVSCNDEDWMLSCWNVTNGTQAGFVYGTGSPVLGVATLVFSPTGSALASAGYDNSLRLWNMSELERVELDGGRRYDLESLQDSECLLRTLRDHTTHVQQLAFSPDGTMLASGGSGALRLWNVQTGEPRRIPRRGRGSVTGLVFDADGHCFVGSSGGRFEVVDAPRGHRDAIEAHDGTLWSLALHPDGSVLASAGEDGTIKLWDAATRRWQRTIEAHTEGVKFLSFSGDGTMLAAGSLDRNIRLWNTSTWENEGTFDMAYRLEEVSLSPDGRMLVVPSGRNLVIWDVGAKQRVRTSRPHQGSVFSVAFSPDGSILATGSDDWTIKLFDASNLEVLETLTGHAGGVLVVAFSPDGRMLASGSKDATVKLWDVSKFLRLEQDKARTVD